MANEISKQQLQEVSIKNYLSAPAISQYIESILGNDKGSFVASLTTIVNDNEKLKNCDKSTIVMAALKATAMKLPIEPALGKAYIIPYGADATFQLGYKGLVELALRTGQYSLLGAREVKEGEFKGYNMVGDPIIQWLSPDARFDKPIIGYMAGFQLTTGFEKTSFWTLAEIDRHANTYSKSYQNYKKYGASQSSAKSGNMTNPWISNPVDMGCKTVLKNLIGKYGVMSIEIQQAIKYDQSVITIDDNMNETIKYIDNPSTPEDTGRITKAQQELLLKTYSAEIINEALYVAGIEDITLIQTDTFDEFVKSCVKLQKDTEKLSK
jgi:recombination protein RecT